MEAMLRGRVAGMGCTVHFVTVSWRACIRLVSSLVVGRKERLPASLLHRTWSRAGRMLCGNGRFLLGAKVFVALNPSVCILVAFSSTRRS